MTIWSAQHRWVGSNVMLYIWYVGVNANVVCILQLFRLWLGVTEYLFRNPDLLEEALDTAIDDNTFRSDDLEFTFAARVSIHMIYETCARPYYCLFNHWSPRPGPIVSRLAISSHTGTASSASRATFPHDSPTPSNSAMKWSRRYWKRLLPPQPQPPHRVGLPSKWNCVKTRDEAV